MLLKLCIRIDLLQKPGKTIPENSHYSNIYQETIYFIQMYNVTCIAYRFENPYNCTHKKKKTSKT